MGLPSVVAQQELRSPWQTLLSPSFPSQWERPYRPQTQTLAVEAAGSAHCLVGALPAEPTAHPLMAAEAAATGLPPHLHQVVAVVELTRYLVHCRQPA